MNEPVTIDNTSNELLSKQPMSAKAYQQGCLETEAPVDTPEAMDRWNRSWQAGLATFGRIMRCIKQSKLDNLKKYAAYGKLPPINEHLCVVNLDDFLSRAWTPSDFSTVELPKVTDSTTMEELLAMPDACKPFRVMHGLMGIATELEEIFDNIIATALKHQYKPVANNPTAIGRSHTRPFMTIADFDKQNISEELGDMLWYISLICNALGLSLQTIMEQNQIKLQEKRYKKKGYSNESAINRDISAEQQVFAAGVSGSCSQLAETNGSIPLAVLNQRLTCPDCGGALVEDPAGQQECPTCEAAGYEEAPASYTGIVPSSRNRHVFFVPTDKADVCNLTTGWYFYDESENEIGPYTTEDEACGKLTEYCNQLGAPVQQQAASPDRACDHCGSPDHIIAFCPSYASLHGTPTKMQQEPVPIPPAPPKRLYKEGDEVKSIRKSLQGVKLVVATDQLGAMVHVREPMVEVANGFHPGTPFDLTSDELVLVKAVAENIVEQVPSSN